jgi:hypothetical protein
LYETPIFDGKAGESIIALENGCMKLKLSEDGFNLFEIDIATKKIQQTS